MTDVVYEENHLKVLRLLEADPGLSQRDLSQALGISLGPVLREQGRLCRSERAWRAERLALQAPVKMLLPLIGCIFPCTFIVLAFPIAVRLLQGGW